MGLRTSSERIEVTGEDAGLLFSDSDKFTEELSTTVTEQTEEYFIGQREKFRQYLAVRSPKRPMRYYWWQGAKNREAKADFEADQARLRGFNQEPPIIPEPRHRFFEQAFWLFSPDDIARLAISVVPKHASELQTYFSEEAMRTEYAQVEHQEQLTWIYEHYLKKPFPHMELDEFLDLEAKQPFRFSDEAEEKNPNKFIRGLIDSEVLAKWIRDSEESQHRYMGYVAQLAGLIHDEKVVL